MRQAFLQNNAGSWLLYDPAWSIATSHTTAKFAYPVHAGFTLLENAPDKYFSEAAGSQLACTLQVQRWNYGRVIDEYKILVLSRYLYNLCPM